MKKYAPWLAATIIVTITFGAIYGSVQQALRLSANDPQIQLAEDTAHRLDSGVTPTQAVSGRVDVGSSLAPFVIIYSKSGLPIAGDGYLDGSLPNIPYGALASAHPGHDNTVTWELQDSIRLASVEVSAHNYYVLSARSLREVEKRENEITDIASLGWFLCILTLATAYLLTTPKKRA